MSKQPKREQAWTGDRQAVHAVAEAVKLVKANATAKFDESVEIAVNLGVDPRHADQNVRGVVALPSGTGRHVRVSLVEPGYVATELQSHNRPEILEAMQKRYHMEETLQADEIADAISYIVTRRRNVAINELLIRPTEQEG